jgi:hypothetical protein
MAKLNLFISYAHEEKEKYLPELLNYLNADDCSEFDIWYDDKISPGTAWDNRIKENLNNADIVLLLLSQSFLISRYIQQNELSVALKRHNDGECRVIPIFVRNCRLDRFPAIKALQGLPRDMTFISDMGEEKYGHYTNIIQHLKDIAVELEADKRLKSRTSITDKNNVSLADKIEELTNKRKIFLSVPSSDDGMKKRRTFIMQVEGKIKYEKWPYEIVPGIPEVDQLAGKTEQQIIDSLTTAMHDSLYAIHIVSSAADLETGVTKKQYDAAQAYAADLPYYKNIVWLLSADIKATLNKEIGMNPIVSGNDYDKIFELIKSLDSEKDKKISQLKKSFSPVKKVYMFYDFSKDHDSDLRIKLKSKIEESDNLAVRFSPPNPTLEKEKEDLEKCEGGCIFYGTADTQWFAYRQSILIDAGYTQSKAICVDEPEIERKIERDVSKNAFITIKGKGDLEIGVKSFLERLQNTLQ